MPIQVVTATGSAVALSNSVRARYINAYMEGVAAERLYDQLAVPIGADMSRLSSGSSVIIPFLSEMAIGTSEISEVIDVVPQTLTDATVSVTPTSRAETLKASERLMLQVYTDYGAKQFERVGRGLMKTVEELARQVATKGDIIERAAARNTMDAGTTTHNITETAFARVSARLQDLQVPGFSGVKGSTYAAIMHPFLFHDLRADSGTTLEVGQNIRPELILNWQLGELGAFRLLVNATAKIFGAAGIDNSSIVATTLSTAHSALAKTLSLAASTHLDNGGTWLTVGTEETGSTHQPANERVWFTSVTDASTVNVAGRGPNGGLMFDHASGVAVRNADSVYTCVFGGPQSLVKVFNPEVGEFGQIVGPRRTGSVDQWVDLGFKWYGNYARIVESRIIRGEFSVKAENKDG